MKPVVLALTLLSLYVTAAPSDAADRPNIVFIFADDLGWRDVGFQGSEFIETPVLDQLAKQSMVFSSGYSSAGNCAPSRACLLSGNYTPRHQNYAVGSTDRGPKISQRLVPVPNINGLPKQVLTMAEALQDAGYATGHFGKWHLAGKQGGKPTEQGFDVSFDSFGDGEVTEGSEGNKSGPPSDPKGVFTLTTKAIKFITENKDKPFFCYLAHHAIHTPLQGRIETQAKFAAKKPDAQRNEVMYAACTYDLDASIGVLIAKLKELGLEENTLLVFTSDNGGTPQNSQEPLRGNKGSYYEGGIREPFIVRWPGMTKPGSTCDVPVINVDLFPTFLDAAGAAVPQGKTLDGESLVPLLKGSESLQRQAIFWHFPGYLDTAVNRGREIDIKAGFRSRPVSVIRKGDWKLHLFHEEWQLDGGREKIASNNAVELYNLSEDIGERNNLANANPSKRDELLSDLLAWFNTTDAVLATEPNPKYDASAATDVSRTSKNARGGKKKRVKK